MTSVKGDDHTNKSSCLVFYVNGMKIIESNPCPRTFLVTYLRETLNLKGTKIGCGEGGCGSCTVVISKFDRKTSTIRHEAMYACMIPVCLLHGKSVTTVEALGSTRTQLHKLQASLVEGHGVQCGFCTPGMLMSMYALLRSNPQPSDLEIEKALRGNLCRCTGYRPIITSFKNCVKELQGWCPLGPNCCQNSKVNENESEVFVYQKKLVDKTITNEHDIIFPSDLQLTDQYDCQFLTFQSKDATWYSPTSIYDLLNLRYRHPHSQIVAGGNVVAYKLKQIPNREVLINISRVKDFDDLLINQNGITLGPNVTISNLEMALQSIDSTLSDYKPTLIEPILHVFRKIASVKTANSKQIFNQKNSKPNLIGPLLDMCRKIASVQIRNSSTVCGALVPGIYGSDLNVLLLTVGCKVTLLSEGGERTLDFDVEFLRSNKIKTNEVISKLMIPFHDKNKYFGFYKLSPRTDLSRAILNCGFYVEFKKNEFCTVKEAFFCYGGMFNEPLVMLKLGELVKGKRWTEELLSSCLEEIKKDFEQLKHEGAILGSDDHVTYILFSMRGLFFKFFVKMLIRLSKIYPDSISLNPTLMSSAEWDELRSNDLHTGSQIYNVDNSLHDVDDLGKPLPHQWASQSTTGEAIFIDDQRHYAGEVCLSMVCSKKAHAKILGVDYSKALKMPGVIGHIDHTSVQGSNIVELFEPRECFASERVYYVGQMIGAILAQTHEQARMACSLVEVKYEELPAVISIEDAIGRDSFHATIGRQIKRGNTERAFKEVCDDVIDNEINIGGQEHFYMETHTARAVPYIEDGGELEIFVGAQFSSGIQQVISKTVNIPQNKINVRVKRMGGAFGGKELSAWLTVVPCAVAALKFNLPVRCMLSRKEDMQMTGNRRSCKAKYRVGFTKEGKIQALDLAMYSNDGITSDWTMLTDITLLNCDNVYSIPNISARGRCCKTNLPTCSAMRGAGAPQAIIIAESIISDVAIHLNKPSHEIREINMYKLGDLSVANTPIGESLQRCYREVKLQSDFNEVVEQVEQFNSKNKYVKRSVSILPIKFNPSLPPFLNKGLALVNIFGDGSVLLSHGGVESGQGLHTKMIQVASRTLGISSSFIKIIESSTSIIPGATTTGGSTGSDLNGMAVMNACEQIVERIQPLRESNPSSSWTEIVEMALKDKINLSSFGYWNDSYNENYDWETGKGKCHAYYTYGAVVTLVEVDCLTGRHVILQVDIVMDVGKSLNPAIDVGQVEGAFIMGLGMCVLEEHKFSSDGSLETIGPAKYHIPTVGDLPLKMNVTLLKDSGNDKAVYSSKGIGEPPLLLSVSVWLAIKDIVSGLRNSQEQQRSRTFVFNTPACPRNVLLACGSLG